ncbi:MAG: VWA domain-containing protein [Clostridia bacterium]|nr:VWA domain-containing protein [Clostridia bacterium]
MNFLFPMGLLGLIGIPILILIYIIKSKYAEQTVASTYLWTLSEKFLKRRRPVSPLTGIISLVLQILAVAAISLIIAHPIITVPDSAKESCFVLDASGSMNMETEGVSRFERGKDEIESIIDRATDGSRYSLILVGDVTTTVFEQTTDKKQAVELLDSLEEGYVAIDYTDALGIAQGYFDDNPSVLTYLVTDTSYEEATNIEVINVAAGEKNASLSDVTWDLSGGQLSVGGSIRCYGEDRNVTVSAYADGIDAPIATAEVQVKAGDVASFELTAMLKTFSSLRLVVSGQDALSHDDEYVIYNVKSEDTYSILLVSDTPFFLETALGAVGHTKVTSISPDDYNSTIRGYGLYIFDCCTPTQAPTDGAVWFFDPKGSVADAGFSVQGEVELSRGELLEKTTSSSSLAKKLTQNIEGDEIYISKYVKCSLYRNFTTLFSYKGNPIVFAGTNGGGHREVVFAFDLHNSNLPMLAVDFIVLMDNLMTFSFPDVIEEVNYYAGDEAAVNVIANCNSIRVQSPLGKVTYLNTDLATATFPLSEVGTYTITVTVSNIPSEFYVYSAMPEEERLPESSAQSIGLQGEAMADGFDGTYDPLTLLFICLALLFLADWMVYCYEKYQLR